jgi:hypothetical protein
MLLNPHTSPADLSQDAAVFAVSAGNYQRRITSPPQESSILVDVANTVTAS